jgi:hypothetical protein
VKYPGVRESQQGLLDVLRIVDIMEITAHSLGCCRREPENLQQQVMVRLEFPEQQNATMTTTITIVVVAMTQ